MHSNASINLAGREVRRSKLQLCRFRCFSTQNADNVAAVASENNTAATTDDIPAQQIQQNPTKNRKLVTILSPATQQKLAAKYLDMHAQRLYRDSAKEQKYELPVARDEYGFYTGSAINFRSIYAKMREYNVAIRANRRLDLSTPEIRRCRSMMEQQEYNQKGKLFRHLMKYKKEDDSSKLDVKVPENAS